MEGEQKERRSGRGRSILIAAAICFCALISALAWRTTHSSVVPTIPPAVVPPSLVLDADAEAQVAHFCGDCHGMPNPGNYSRAAWLGEVERGYEFYARSGRSDLQPPPMQAAIAYFQQRAPAELEFPPAAVADHPLGVRFQIDKFPAAANVHFPPAIAHLRWAQLTPNAAHVLIASDMRQGIVAAVDLAGGSVNPKLLGRLNNPCHAEPCDLNSDGAIDLVVADMGGLAAVDFDLGRVVWLRRDSETDEFEPVVLATGLGRVSDVRPADLDGDGKLDLLIGEFGARQGGIRWLRNLTPDGGEVAFAEHVIDRRPGTVHLLVDDLNGDQRLDFVALVSQEFEAVDAFINRGDGTFQLRPLWEAADPAFGSSGAQLVDLDQDGDADILFSNGDSFDEKYVKPCHGVQWLENQGDLSFAYHRLTDLPGTYRAAAGDIDLDGDLDVVAAVWVEPRVQFGNPQVKEWVSIVCLEQTEAGTFVRHNLASEVPWYATLELADFDADGDLDLAFGAHSRGPTLQLDHWLSVWWNQGRR